VSDDSATVFSGTALPTSLELAAFDAADLFLSFTGTSGNPLIEGSVTSVPEPDAGLGAAITLGGLAIEARRRRGSRCGT
jgi:hypothetical protein